MRTLQKLHIAIRVMLRAITRGPSRAHIETPKRLLVIQRSQLGDMVCTTPVFRAIKQEYPDSKLTVLGLPGNQELLKYNPDVDEYIPYDKNFSSLLRKVRAGNFDFACMTSPNFISFALVYLGGVSLVVVPRIVNGYSPYATRLYRIFMGLGVVVPHHMRNYAPREYLDLLRPIGIISENTQKHLGFSSEAGRSIDSFFNKHEIAPGSLVVGISPAAGNKIKMWPVERFARIADYLVEKHNAKIIVLASRQEERIAKEMISHMNRPVIQGTEFNLDELKALVSRLSLFISVDTGPIYIAEAFGVSTIDITGPIDEHEQPPISPRHLIIPPRHRTGPQLFVMNARVYDSKEAQRQAADIQPEDVIPAIDTLVKQ